MTDRMTNAEIEALCEAFDKASKSDSLMVAFAPAMFAKALTAIRQLQQPWLPIDSAPKDGTEFVMMDTATNTAVVGHWMADVEWRNAGKLPGEALCKAGWFPLAAPNAWMPLPHAPEPGQ